MAVDSREVMSWKGARYSSSRMLTSNIPQGGSTNPTARRIVATGGAARPRGGDPQYYPPPENYIRRASNNVRTPAAI
jgi:hypothetical protein